MVAGYDAEATRDAILYQTDKTLMKKINAEDLNLDNTVRYGLAARSSESGNPKHLIKKRERKCYSPGGTSTSTSSKEERKEENMPNMYKGNTRRGKISW